MSMRPKRAVLFSDDIKQQVPVFSDPTSVRSRRVKRFLSAAIILSVAWIMTIGLHVFKIEHGRFILPVAQASLFAPSFASDTGVTELGIASLSPTTAGFASIPHPDSQANCAGQRGRQDALVPGSRDIFAFLTPAPRWSYSSLAAHCAQIDVLVPAWFEIEAADATVKSIETDYDLGDAIHSLINTNRNNFAVMPTVSLGAGFTADGVAARLGTPENREPIVVALRQAVVENDLDGLCLDTNGFPPETAAIAAALMQQLGAALKDAQRKACVITSFDNQFWMNTDLVSASDRVVVTMVRTPFVGSLPAPIAPQQWFVEAAAFVASRVSSEKLVFALGTGGYNWESGTAEPILTDYTSLISQTALYQGQLTYFDIDLNSQTTYVDKDQKRHVSWFLDAATFYNQLRVLEDYGLAGVAVWTIGREDPGIWDVLALQGAPIAALVERLGVVSVAKELRYFGEGQFYRLLSEAVDGQRQLRVGETDKLIHAQEYAILPRPVMLERHGAPKGNQVTLTFDDGPSTIYTEQILDILRDRNVKATFFVVGQNIVNATSVLRRIVQEGHTLGSHSFSHPRLEDHSPSRIRLELNSLQRIVAGMTGHRMVLFRTPYEKGNGPIAAANALPIRIASSMGYVEMGSDVVTYDWTHISAAEIVAHARNGVRNGGSVIMLHDSGNDRSETVAALGPMIDQLREEGYNFVSAAEMIGASPDELMPLDDSFGAKLDGYSLRLAISGLDFVVVLFWATVGLGLLRSATIIVLALLRRPKKHPAPGTKKPWVTVVIAAYNEAAVIEESIKTILASDYKKLRVLVIDDGSSDNTARVVRKAFRNNRHRVQVFSQANGGKWRALNAAYRLVTTDIVVAIDADTILRKDAISKLVAPFSDPLVGAVAGNVKVGNRLNILTCLQAMEYITAQNLERRAFDKIGGMLVVPGAIGAWRVAAVRQAGGYSGDTLAEDADLTVSIQRQGYKVCFVDDAISVTEAPATIEAFLKQRLRWTLGMMQMAWKHRRAISERRVIGLVSMIDLQIFGILFALFAPIADLVLIGTFFVAISEFLAGRPPLDPNASYLLIAGYIILPMMDVLMAITALRLDRRTNATESYWLLAILPFQRVFYRQLLYFTVYRSVWRAITGRLAKWGNLTRMGTVKLAKWT